MPKDIAKEFLRVKDLLVQERRRLQKRLAYLEAILALPELEEEPAAAPDLEPGSPEADEALQEELHRPVERRGRPRRRSVPAPEASRVEIHPEAQEYPLALFPFPARAARLFQDRQLEKLGQLNGLELNTLKGKGVSRGTLEAIAATISRINSGELCFLSEEAAQTTAFAALVDAGLERLEPLQATAIGLKWGAESEPVKMEEIAQRSGVTYEAARQAMLKGLAELLRMHGAKFVQIGKKLAALRKERPIGFEDISAPGNPPKWRQEFYRELLYRFFPGLKTQTENGHAKLLPAEASPEDLRKRLFAGN